MSADESSLSNQNYVGISGIKTNAKTRITAAQTNALCIFFEENPEVIRGYRKNPECVETVQAKWRNITHTLNSLGPPRDCKAWAKYLCDMKAKLKKKRIKWRQKSDGSGPIICNADEFNEIKLRMLQVLRKDITSENISKPLAGKTERCIKRILEEDSKEISKKEEPNKPIDCDNLVEICINVTDDDDSSVENMSLTYGNEDDQFRKTVSAEKLPQEHLNVSDAFDAFRKNIAVENMPHKHMVIGNEFVTLRKNISIENVPEKHMAVGNEFDTFRKNVSVENIALIHLVDGDEFDTFGKNIAQQLRYMPLELALETQEMLLAVLRRQRLRATKRFDNNNPDTNKDPLLT